jgi:hypothetical protein
MGANYTITNCISKSLAARKLKINRKTIQRKVQAGKLSQDEHGRIRWDELVGVLKAESRRSRRGPKITIPKIEHAQKIYHYDPKRGFVESTLEPSEAVLTNRRLDEEAVARLMLQMADLTLASLEAVVKDAYTLIEHKSRLAKVGLFKSGAEILAALEISPPHPATPTPRRVETSSRGNAGGD